MRVFSFLLFLLATFSCTGSYTQNKPESTLSWDQEAQSNIRLRPKYGLVEKTESQKEADKEFVEATLNGAQFKGNKRAASDHMIKLGFVYLNRGDLKTAMYRFNQAYLLDPDNPEQYWGYAAVYMSLEKYEDARLQYQAGLELQPDNTHLLTDLGTYYVVMHINNRATNPAKAIVSLDTAITIFNRSYELDKHDPNTSFKLSAAYFSNGDCKNALKYLDICDQSGGDPVTDDYREALATMCNPKK